MMSIYLVIFLKYRCQVKWISDIIVNDQKYHTMKDKLIKLFVLLFIIVTGETGHESDESDDVDTGYTYIGYHTAIFLNE